MADKLPKKTKLESLNDDAIEAGRARNEYLVIELWDSLPDYLKNDAMLNKLKLLSDNPILEQLVPAKY